MSKLLRSVLEKVSENNNDYRNNLRTLNRIIDERTSTLVGELVTISSYTLDFSKTLSEAKEILVNPVSRIIESYVIKDLRSVETVNEQFVEKINDKIETQNITNDEEKKSFTNSLNKLLNEKYLEIVKIKRVDFFNENGINDEIEDKINDYILGLKQMAVFNENLDMIISQYKNDIYKSIKETLKDISNLYQNNFINEVSSNLNGVIEVDNSIVDNGMKEEPKKEVEEFKPYIPDTLNIPEVPVVPEIPEFAEPVTEENLPVEEVKKEEAQVEPIFNLPVINEAPAFENTVEEIKPVENKEEVNEMEYTPIKPIEVTENPKEEAPREEVKVDIPKHSYNVDEILKIAKSPILDMPSVKKEEVKEQDSYVNVNKIEIKNEDSIIESEYDEEEIVREMINRLTNRLNLIRERKKSYEDSKNKLEEDERFVNDLIESSKTKKQELDRFEQELNEKEEYLNNKQKELDKKINDIMPFANKVLESEES